MSEVCILALGRSVTSSFPLSDFPISVSVNTLGHFPLDWITLFPGLGVSLTSCNTDKNINMLKFPIDMRSMTIPQKKLWKF